MLFPELCQMFCVAGRNSKWSYGDIIKVEVKVRKVL